MEQIAAEIFRSYDIRGIFGNTLTESAAHLIGQAIGSTVLECGGTTLIVARDGRLSGPALQKSLIEGALQTGCDVIDLGEVTTPVLYFATCTLASRSGVMITGSHNPPDYNGMKIVIQGETLSGARITGLYDRIIEKKFKTGAGKYATEDLIDRYIDRIKKDVHLKKPFKIVIDAGHGVGGKIAPQLFEQLGCDVIPLYCDVDGRFPAHEPDPSHPENLADLISTVKKTGADLGLAFDGDADRVGVVTEEGEIIWPDRQLMLYAIHVLKAHPGAEIIFDVKCSSHLATLIQEHGGKPLMWKTGHSFIKAKLKETKAPLAGEMSGHTFFNDRWYGFDDGIYTAARLLEILSTDPRKISDVFKSLPNSINTPELKLPVTEDRKFALMDTLHKTLKFSDATLSTIDGIRVDFKDGWGLVRPSNTSPYLILRFEADTTDALLRIQHEFRDQLLRVDPTLNLPF